MRIIKYLAVHCTAGSQAQTAKQVVEYHHRPMAKGGRGWKSPGYHYIIEPNGTVVATHPEDLVSNGVTGFNQETINICWIGGVDVSKRGMPAIDNRTTQQKDALRELLTTLHSKYPKAIIKGHRDFSSDKNGNGKIDSWERIKECPCFDAITEYKDIQQL